MFKKLGLYTQATKLSLENAEQWIKDAKLLINSSSFGHASALLRFACEETAKAYICWLTSRKIIPLENKIIKNAFWNHRVKNEVILSTLYSIEWLSKNQPLEEVAKKRLKLSEEKIVEAYEQFEAIVDSTEKMRQKAMYVNLNSENAEVQTPLTIGKDEVKDVREMVEIFLKIVKYYIEEMSETEKETLRKFYSTIPREAWKTGEIPIEWLSHDK